jgi:hypothetical protein
MLDLGVAGVQDRPLMGLSSRERAILDLECWWWTRTGSKEAAIRADTGLSSTRYYEVLRHLVDDRAAYDYDPLTVMRLRRDRDRRRRAKVVGRRADPGSR